MTYLSSMARQTRAYVAVLFALIAAAPQVFAVSNTFSYQGSLQDGAAAANGSYDLRFTLETTTGAPIAAPLLRDDVQVSLGVFSVELDFGSVIINGDYQLQIGVRPGASVGAFTTLSPPTRINPTPQAQIAGLAIHAGSAGSVSEGAIRSDSVLDGALGAVDVNTNEIQRRVAVGCPSGASIRNVEANGTVTCEASGSGPVGPAGPTGATGAPGSADAWSRTGSVGTDAALNFIGTTDSEPMLIKVNGERVAKFVTANGSAQVLLGSSANEANQAGATVGGGGATLDGFGAICPSCRNAASASFATVAGGQSNTAGGSSSTVGGGRENYASEGGSVVSGGLLNYATAYVSTVSGGQNNVATGANSTVSGGVGNCAGGDSSWAGGHFASVRVGNEVGDGTCSPNSGDANGDQGTFVWSDAQSGAFVSTGPNQFLVAAAGGMAINTNTPNPGMALTINGNASFGSFRGQLLNLFGPSSYGIGVQDFTLYSRTDVGGGFAWFQSGVHSDTQNDPGAGGTVRMRLNNAGQLFTTTGSIATLSDARLKTDVSDYTGALDQISALRPVHFRYRDADKAAFQAPGQHLGFIAQELQTVFPQWVSADEDGYLTLSMRGFEAVAVRAIQELDAKQSSALRKLRLENAALRARLDALENQMRH